MAQKHLLCKKYNLLLTVLIIVLLSVQSFAGVTTHTDKRTSTKRLRTMARVYMTYGNYDKARVYAEKALSEAQATDTEANEMALCLIDLATVYSNLDLLPESDRLFQAGISLQKQALFGEHPYVAQTYRMLSDVQRRAGHLDEAEQSLSQAVAIMLNHCDIQSNEMSPFILESAKLFEARQDYEQAQINYMMALDMAEENYGPRHLMTANILESMAQCALRQDDFEQADICISKAMSIQRNLFGRLNPVMVDVFLTKATICRAKGEADRSEYYLAQATASVEESRNVVMLARVYERVNQIRRADVIAAAANLN